MSLEKKAALADLLLEHLALISSLRHDNSVLLEEITSLRADNEHLRSELSALEALTGNTPPPEE